MRKLRNRSRVRKKIRVNIRTLPSDLWVRNTQDVSNLRSCILSENNNTCELTGELIKRPTLDHDHLTGRNRGVISQHNNTMEGYVLKYFNKYVKNHTELSLPNWLRSLATYYETSFIRGLHFRTVHDMQTKLSNMTKESISSKMFKDFNIVADHDKMSKASLIEMYLEKFVENLEDDYKSVLTENASE